MIAFSLWLAASSAFAEPANGYGAKGRTVISTGLSGAVMGSGYTQSHQAWNASARVTLVHFIQDNFALGGTITADVSRPRDLPTDELIAGYSGGDVDFLGHVPLTHRLSLRFWGWAGVRSHRKPTITYDPYYGSEEVYNARLLHGVLGFSPELLLHLSSSVAVSFGPSCAVYVPLNGPADWDWSLNFGPSVSYSFGPAPRALSADEKPVIPRFAQRGRNVLAGGVNVGSSLGGSVSYARFVSDHFALGPRVLGGAATEDHATPFWFGAGLMMLAELPLRGRWSMLFAPSVDYRYDRITLAQRAVPNRNYYQEWGYGGAEELYQVDYAKVHELQFTGSVMPVFHVFEALVLGLGPSVTEHVRIASSVQGLERAYLSLGVGSILAGSF